MDDLWDLWTGTGLVDELRVAEHKFTLDSALNELGFRDEEQRHSSCSGTFRRVSVGDIDAEGLFNNRKPIFYWSFYTSYGRIPKGFCFFQFLRTMRETL